ncbi:hypothetical protein GCM10010326_49100 [Streptomyces xanthochromogenes]|uniref:Uncharacterized protein n=1 Tax=Streptomyces xanthochromogenes TaxID=67384 RepID=A0ABQ3AGR9_9ACTN|nr:hypothetical protein GCM10010326_49100 [Streptomyces xanthochromogenes]
MGPGVLSLRQFSENGNCGVRSGSSPERGPNDPVRPVRLPFPAGHTRRGGPQLSCQSDELKEAPFVVGRLPEAGTTLAIFFSAAGSVVAARSASDIRSFFAVLNETVFTEVFTFVPGVSDNRAWTVAPAHAPLQCRQDDFTLIPIGGWSAQRGRTTALPGTEFGYNRRRGCM